MYRSTTRVGGFASALLFILLATSTLDAGAEPLNAPGTVVAGKVGPAFAERTVIAEYPTKIGQTEAGSIFTGGYVDKKIRAKSNGRVVKMLRQGRWIAIPYVYLPKSKMLMYDSTLQTELGLRRDPLGAVNVPEFLAAHQLPTAPSTTTPELPPPTPRVEPMQSCAVTAAPVIPPGPQARTSLNYYLNSGPWSPTNPLLQTERAVVLRFNTEGAWSNFVYWGFHDNTVGMSWFMSPSDNAGPRGMLSETRLVASNPHIAWAMPADSAVRSFQAEAVNPLLGSTSGGHWVCPELVTVGWEQIMKFMIQGSFSRDQVAPLIATLPYGLQFSELGGGVNALEYRGLPLSQEQLDSLGNAVKAITGQPVVIL